MSLLIKALNKAEEAQAQNAKAEKGKANAETKGDKANSDLELSLSPTDDTLAEASPASMAKAAAVQNKIQASSQTPIQTANQTKSQTKSQANSQATIQAVSQASRSVAAPLAAATSTNSPNSAANVFSSKGVDVSKQNSMLALIAGAGLIALLGIGLYYYQFADNTPDVVIPPRPLEQLAATQQPEVSAAMPEQTTEVQVAETATPQAFEPDEPVAAPEPEPEPQPEPAQQEAQIKKLVKQAAINRDEELAVSENEVVVDETIVAANTNKKGRKSKSLQFGESIASPSASINVSRTKAEAAGINPVLMSAYEAYNAGNDSEAQKLYKQVLQRDVRNVDALLGLGAIATRQGRDADANGWYGKVLEVDPRNSMAQAAMLDNLPQGNEANSESRIKNMLAKNPNDANLHVALGNLYAEQNQWPAAQQAYFDAYSLNTSADNAFNLAVSLDQMGKPKLALPYYQRALEQASSTSSIDKAALEARIAAIQ